MTVPPAPRPALHRALVPALLAVLVALLSPVAPAHAGGGYLCTGYAGCAKAGYPHHGYKQASDQMWWRMFSGHNCTNYVAYRLVKRGMSPERPWDSTGMAYNWGRANRHLTDQTPTVGSVAWWNAGDGVGSSGHVAYVEQVISSRKIVISEDSWGGDFHWRVVTKDGAWPTGFIHFLDEELAAVEPPAVTGTPAVGQTLTADPGAWSAEGTQTVQWLAAGKPVAGATGLTLTPGPDLVRSRLSVRVTVSAPGYAPTTATSEPTTRVQRGDLAVDREPGLSGTPRVDEVLTVDPGQASPTPTASTVQWYADGAPLEGRTGPRLTLGQEHIGRQITAQVTSRLDGYKALRRTTAPSEPVRAGKFQVSEPFALEGRARLDRTLTVRPGVYTPADADVAYTWLRDGEPVADATGPSYTPGLADVGHRLAVRVDLTRAGYRDHSATLEAATPVRSAPDLAVRTVGRTRRAVVVLTVEAPGVAAPDGEAVVRLGRRQAVRGDVVDGALRAVFRDQRPGTKRVRVRYLGTEVVLPGRARTTVQVLR